MLHLLLHYRYRQGVIMARSIILCMALILTAWCTVVGEKIDSSHKQEGASDKYKQNVEDPVKVVSTPDANGYILYCPCMGKYLIVIENEIDFTSYKMLVPKKLTALPDVCVSSIYKQRKSKFSDFQDLNII